MNVSMVATVAVITAEPSQSRQLFIETLGLPLEGEGEGYYSSGNVPGCNHFGVWPLVGSSRILFWNAGVARGLDRAPSIHRVRSR